MNDQERREAGRRFGEMLREKAEANRRGYTSEYLTERLAGRQEEPSGADRGAADEGAA